MHRQVAEEGGAEVEGPEGPRAESKRNKRSSASKSGGAAKSPVMGEENMPVGGGSSRRGGVGGAIPKALLERLETLSPEALEELERLAQQRKQIGRIAATTPAPTAIPTPEATPTTSSPQSGTPTTTPPPVATLRAATPAPAGTPAATPAPARTPAVTPAPAGTSAATQAPAGTPAATPAPASLSAPCPSPGSAGSPSTHAPPTQAAPPTDLVSLLRNELSDMDTKVLEEELYSSTWFKSLATTQLLEFRLKRDAQQLPPDQRTSVLGVPSLGEDVRLTDLHTLAAFAEYNLSTEFDSADTVVPTVANLVLSQVGTFEVTQESSDAQRRAALLYKEHVVRLIMRLIQKCETAHDRWLEKCAPRLADLQMVSSSHISLVVDNISAYLFFSLSPYFLASCASLLGLQI
jgi:hypothetical protein